MEDDYVEEDSDEEPHNGENSFRTNVTASTEASVIQTKQ